MFKELLQKTKIKIETNKAKTMKAGDVGIENEYAGIPVGFSFSNPEKSKAFLVSVDKHFAAVGENKVSDFSSAPFTSQFPSLFLSSILCDSFIIQNIFLF